MAPSGDFTMALDTVVLVLLARTWPDWRSPLLFVQPETPTRTLWRSESSGCCAARALTT
jgi:hypothetical protein